MRRHVSSITSAALIFASCSFSCSSFEGGTTSPEDSGVAEAAVDSGAPESGVDSGCKAVTVMVTTFADGVDATADVGSDSTDVFWRTTQTLHKRSLSGEGVTSSWEAGESISSLVLSSQYATHLKGSVLVSHEKAAIARVYLSTDADWTGVFGDRRSLSSVVTKGVVVSKLQPPGAPTQLFPDLALRHAAFSGDRILLYGSIQGAPPALHSSPPPDIDMQLPALVDMTADSTALFYSDESGSLWRVPMSGGDAFVVARQQPTPLERLELSDGFLYYRTPMDLRRVHTTSGCIDIVQSGSFGSFSVSGQHVFATQGNRVVDIAIAN